MTTKILLAVLGIGIAGYLLGILTMVMVRAGVGK